MEEDVGFLGRHFSIAFRKETASMIQFSHKGGTEHPLVSGEAYIHCLLILSKRRPSGTALHHMKADFPVLGVLVSG